jgi:hypothetical protein
MRQPIGMRPDNFSLNVNKTKEMIVDYRKRGPSTPPFSSTGL